MTTKHEAALRALDAAYERAQEVRRNQWAYTYAEEMLVEHWPTIRDALTAQGERVAEGCDCSFGDTCSCAYDCRCRAELKHLREEGGELINTGLRLVALEAPAPSAPPAESQREQAVSFAYGNVNLSRSEDQQIPRQVFYDIYDSLHPPAHSADTEVRWRDG